MKSDVNSLRTCQQQLVDLQNENAILRERLYQLEQILDILPESLICQDLKNQEIFYSNHAFQQQSRENQAKISEVSKVTNNRHPVEKTTEIKLNDTEERYLAIHQIPLRNSQRKISYLVTFSQDITELKQLQQSQQLLLSIIDSLPQMIFWKDRNSIFLGCNRYAAQICGFSSPTEIIGKTDYDMPTTEEESEWYRECDFRIMETNTPELNIVETQHRPDGSQAWINTHKVPLHDQEGNVTGIVVSIEDITEKKHTEAQLQEVTARWQRIAASTPGLFYQYCQSPTDPIGKFTFLSEGCYDIYELDPEAALHDNSILWELVHPEDLPTFQQSVTQAFTLKAVWQTEYRITTPSGKLKWLQATAMPCKQNDENVYWDGVILDTTELKKTEFALSRSEKRLRRFFEQCPLAAIEWDADFRVVEWNHTAEKIFGYSKAEVHGKLISELNLVPPSAQDDVDQVIQKLLAGTGGTFSINENITKTGKIIVCEWHNFAFYDDDRQLISIFTMAHDVTERQKIQSELLQQRQLLRTIVDTLPQAIFWKDCNSIYKGCNSTFIREINHQPCSEIVGNTDYNLASNEEEARLEQQSDQEVMQSGKPQMHLVEQRQLPNGNLTWLDICKVPLVDENGRIFGILGTYADITERKRTEQQLREKAQREQLFNQIISQIRQSLDIETILNTTLNRVRELMQTDRCLFFWYCTDAEEPYCYISNVSQLPGLPDIPQKYPASILGSINQKVLHLEVIKIVDTDLEPDRTFQKLLKSLGIQSFLSVPFQKTSGQIGALVCNNHTQVRNWNDTEISLLQAVVEQLDIALTQVELYNQSRSKTRELETTLKKLKRTQAQMIQNEKMSSLGQLVAGVAHEINNPVSFIYGNLSYAKQYTQDLFHLIELYQTHYPNPHTEIQEVIEEMELEFLQEDLPKLLNSMKVGANRIEDIVKSLRNFSRLDQSGHKKANLHEGIDSTLTILYNRINRRNHFPAIEIVKNYGNIPQVECYPGQLNQVFIHIISNAIDAIEEKDAKRTMEQIKSEPSLIEISTKIVGKFVQICIRDNGTGIPPEVKERLFDPFFSTKDVGKGTGLGLSISYEIVVEKHGGSLKCNSNLGKVTEFVMKIPMKLIPFR